MAKPSESTGLGKGGGEGSRSRLVLLVLVLLWRLRLGREHHAPHVLVVVDNLQQQLPDRSGAAVELDQGLLGEAQLFKHLGRFEEM